MSFRSELVPAKSMGKQAANWARSEQALRDAAKNPFAEPAVPVSASHNQIGAYLMRNADQLACGRSHRMFWRAHSGGYAVAREVSGHILDRRLGRRFIGTTEDFNNRHGYGLTEQRQ